MKAISFAAWLRQTSGDKAADEFLSTYRDTVTGISSARGTWHALSTAQRRVLRDAAAHGRLERVGKAFRRGGQVQGVPIRIATVEKLCGRKLLAWVGDAPDPESAASMTERGYFVLKRGPES